MQVTYKRSLAVGHLSTRVLLSKVGLSLPPLVNSVAIHQDSLLLACGGWNAIVKIDFNGNYLAHYGGVEGILPGHLREPVHIAAGPDGKFLVSDWRNHRLVVLSPELHYVGEFGSYGRLRPCTRMQKVVRYCWAMTQPATPLFSHFGGSTESLKTGLPRWHLFASLYRFGIERNGGLRRWLSDIATSMQILDKPNGACHTGSQIVVSQKNNQCISVFETRPPYRNLGTITGVSGLISFGRLGNVSFHNGSFYLCDEHAGRVWKLDETFLLRDTIKGLSSGTKDGKFLPFSCQMLDERYLAICGGKNLQVFDTKKRGTVFVSRTFGELHGLTFDSLARKIFVADRLEGAIHIFNVELKK